MNAPSEANAKQQQLWNGTLGEIWSRRQEQFNEVLRPAGMAALDAAGIQKGDRVVDVGCGCGGTTLDILDLVGPEGEVLAVDISEPMLAQARAQITPDKPVYFVEADAATYTFSPANYDVLFSRFGVMFFANPAEAFANMRSALRLRGRLAFSCFRAPAESPYLMVPLSAVHKHQVPSPPVAPGTAGMFSFADKDRLQAILETAGFSDIKIQARDLDLDISAGGGVDAAVEISMELGPSGNALMDKPDELRRAVARTMRTTLLPYQRDDNTVPLAAGLWIVTAIN